MGIIADELAARRRSAPMTLREAKAAERAQNAQVDAPLPGGESMLNENLEALITGTLLSAGEIAGNTPDFLAEVGRLAHNAPRMAASSLADMVLGMAPGAPSGHQVAEKLKPLQVFGPETTEGTPIRDRMAAATGVDNSQELLAEVASLAGDDYETSIARTKALADRNPVMTGIGTFIPDLYALTRGKQPIRASLRSGKTGGAFDEPIKRFLAKRVPEGEDLTGFAGQSKALLESDMFSMVARGAGRTLETGLEAEALNMLHGGDPAEVIGLAMGTQLVSSLALTGGAMAMDIPVKLFNPNMGPILKLSAGVGIQAWLLGNLLQVAGDNPLEAESTAYDKAMMGFILAASIGLPGKRPKPDGALANFPGVADAVLAVPRGAALSFMRALQEDPISREVNEMVAQYPDKFSTEDLKRYEKIMRSGGDGLVEWSREMNQKHFGGDATGNNGLPPALLSVPKSSGGGAGGGGGGGL